MSRNVYMRGKIDFDGQSFDFGSGGRKGASSIPPGTYPITPDVIGPWSRRNGGIGINNNSMWDASLGRNREGIVFHKASNAQMVTAGCLGIAPEQWDAFRAKTLDYVKQNGKAYLTVNADGSASIGTSNEGKAGPANSTFAKSLPSAAGLPTPTVSPAAATRATGFSVSPEQYFGGDVSGLPAGLRNNNPGNLKYSGSQWQQRNYPGMIGPSRNTDQGTPQIVFDSPQSGMNAAKRLAEGKYTSGMTTPRAIITGQNGWTPGNIGAATNIARSMGVGLDDDMRLNDPERMQSFLKALTLQEHGPAGSSRLGADLYQNATASGAAPAPGGSPQRTQLASNDPNFSLGMPQRAQTAEPQRAMGAFAGFSPTANNAPIVPRLISMISTPSPAQAAPVAASPTSIPGAIPFANPVPAPQAAPQAAPAVFTPPTPVPAPVAAPTPPQASPDLPQRAQGVLQQRPGITDFLPQSFAQVAGITPNDPTPLGQQNGMVQVGSENAVRRPTTGSDPFFGHAATAPMSIAPQPGQTFVSTDANPDPAPAENPLVVRGIRPRSQDALPQPQPQMVPLPPQRPGNDQLFPQMPQMPERAQGGLPMQGSTPTIWGANWHGPDSGLINRMQVPMGTPYPDVWTGPSPYPMGGGGGFLGGLLGF